jgi:hypothetical protein
VLNIKSSCMEAFGNGQDYGHVPLMLGGAKAHVQAIGPGEDYFAGKLLSADSNYHSEESLKACAQDKLDAYIPDPHFLMHTALPCNCQAPSASTPLPLAL